MCRHLFVNALPGDEIPSAYNLRSSHILASVHRSVCGRVTNSGSERRRNEVEEHNDVAHIVPISHCTCLWPHVPFDHHDNFQCYGTGIEVTHRTH